MAWDSDDWLVGGLFTCILIIIVTTFGWLGIAIYDTVKEREAFDKIAACQISRGIPKRQSLTTKVVCIPDNARQDTSTVTFHVTQQDYKQTQRDSSVREFAKDLSRMQEAILKQSAK